MPSEPLWLQAEDVVQLNIGIVEATGEPHQVRDLGLLESACAVPANRFFYGGDEDVVALAASLMAAIARNHPFAQGNKRTAFVAGELFLRTNGYSLAFMDTQDAADLFVQVIQGHASEETFEVVLRQGLNRLD